MAEFIPSFVENEEQREVIIKLGHMITNRIPYRLGLKKLTKYDPEYWGLSLMLTDEQAEVCLKMEIRKPKTFEQIQKLTGIEAEHLQELLDDMSFKGIVEYNWENPRREKQYVLPMFVPGSAEFMNMNQAVLNEHPEMGRFFEQMSRLPLEKVTPMVPPGGAGIGMHVIPVEKAIGTDSNSIGIEHISYWLDKYDGKYAKSPCSCRKSRITYDEGCADDPEGWCIAVGDMADYVVETGKGGEYITREEALAIFKQAEDNGFVHEITNIDGEDKIFAICNCNVNVCYALRTSQLFNTPNMSRSAYVARVTKEDCMACGKCVEHCPAGAVKLGQKLCKKDGSEVEYPRHILPGEVKWGEHMWEPDYRNVNRKNCYDTGTAPCKTACPAHIAIQGYLKLASQGRYTDALALIKKDNPLPAICGRICNHRCEDACTRGTVDQAIAIDAVKDFIAQQDLKSETRYIPKKIVPSLNGSFDDKIAIIGSGPAGLSCAFFLAEKGYSPTIFEKNEKPGGMLRYGVPSFNLEKDIIDAEIEVIEAMGVEIKCGIEVGKDVTIQQLREQGYKAFYIAIGCQEGRKAGIPGEDAEGVESAVKFLRDVAGDENKKVEGRVVVIGGGNVAVDVARSANRCGTDSVEVYCLEKAEEMPASADELAEINREGIRINNSWGPKEIITENGKVKAVVFRRCLSVYDGERFAPSFDEEETVTVECEHVIMAIGQSVVWGNLLEGTKVALSKGGWPVADPLTNQTGESDIFVGGDVYTGPKYSIDAIACGREGAISLHRFVRPHSSLTIGRNRRDFIELDKDNIRVENYDNTPRQIAARNKDIDPKSSFRDGRYSFTEEQVKAETARCLSCGASVVDPNKCIGCGVCTTKCEFDAIKLYRERPECSKMVPSEDKLKYVLSNGAKQAIKRKLRGK